MHRTSGNPVKFPFEQRHRPVARLMLGAACIAAMFANPASAREPSRPLLLPVPFTTVQIDDPFWSPRLEVNRIATIPHLLDMCELEGRVRNFWRAAGKLDGPFEGTRRHDADLYKAIEAAAYSLAIHPDAVLRQRVETMIDAIAAAQQSDGYLDTYGTVGRPPGKPRREPDLFAAGHLLDAAVAWHEATGSRRLLDVARRLADRINRTTGTDALRIPPHPKIEAALDRLFSATSEQRHLELARSFLNERGRAGVAGSQANRVHNQTHLPVRNQTAAEGHVICGLFLCEGMHDIGLRTGDRSLVEASRRIYQDCVTRRFYLTGAMGRAADERFTDSWTLDNRTAIGEGCQSAALARLALRLLLLEADARHADVFERVLYNNLLANVGVDGRTFFYVNRLAARPEDATGRPYVHPLAETERERLPRFCLARQPWFKVPCCPPNVALTLATLGQWIYARSPDAIFINLYVGSRATIPAGGTSVRVSQESKYPWEGRIRIAVEPAAARTFTVALRIPDWCRDLESVGGLYRARRPSAGPPIVVRVNGHPVDAGKRSQGYLPLRRAWRPGDVVEFDLPLPVLRIVADPRVTANAGRVALQRGPVVYCVEAVDHGGHTRDLGLPRQANLTAEHRPDLLGGVTVLRGTGLVSDASSPAGRPLPLVAVPYGVWGNRTPGEMDVWLREF